MANGKNDIDYAGFRERFAKEYGQNVDLCDEVDYKKVMENDFWVRRFVKFQNQGFEKGYQHMKDTLAWRKRTGINHFDPAILPTEVYQLGALFPYRPDKDGTLMLYMRGKMHFKVRELEDRIQLYLAYCMDQLDAKADKEGGWAMVLDSSNTTYANADLDMLLFLMRTARHQFPCGVKYVFVVGLPWILRVFASLILSLLPSESVKKVQFCDNKKLFDTIPEENVPEFLHGQCKDPCGSVPRGVLSAHELGVSIGMTRKEVDSLLKLIRDYLPSGESQELENK